MTNLDNLACLLLLQRSEGFEDLSGKVQADALSEAAEPFCENGLYSGSARTEPCNSALASGKVPEAIGKPLKLAL